MELLTPDDILDVDTYEAVRPGYRARVIAHKNDRRLGVGDKVTVVFEDRETLRYQIQEMTRIEQIRDPSKVQGEIDAYNALMPGENELSATLFIEIPDLEKVKPELDLLVGIDECVALELCDASGSVVDSIRARFDEGQMEEDRISAVQYVRFAFTPEQAKRFAEASAATLRIDHANYRCAAPLPDHMLASLKTDLAGPAVSLLDVEAARGLERPKDEIVERGDVVRVRIPQRKLAAEHWIVEASDPALRLDDADDATLLALFRRARDLAADVKARGAHPRIVTELAADQGSVGARAAIHVLAGRALRGA